MILLPQYYSPIFMYSVLVLSVIQYLNLQSVSQYTLLAVKKSNVGMITFCIAFILIVGLRPVSFWGYDKLCASVLWLSAWYNIV